MITVYKSPFMFSRSYNNLKFRMFKTSLCFLLLLCLGLALSMRRHEESVAQFCWKDSYGRGVGKIPSVCPDDRDKIGLLCYSKCPDNYKRVGFDCHQQCLDGWDDQGLFCRLSEYGRGAGYPWKGSDGFSSKGMKKRCEKDHGSGNCEKDGAIYYPKCKSGFNNVGCCICRPSTPNCDALGYNGGIDLSCAKRIKIGDPKSMGCSSGQDYDAGLCYDKCKSGFDGVGPVCWAGVPSGWVTCGMGAAKSSKVCAQTVFDQVSSVGNLALNIATFGARQQAAIAQDAAKAAQLKKQYEDLKALTKTSEQMTTRIKTASGNEPKSQSLKDTQQILDSDSSEVTTEDIIRVAAQIAALADPTGIADAVAAYTYPKCNQIST